MCICYLPIDTDSFPADFLDLSTYSVRCQSQPFILLRRVVKDDVISVQPGWPEIVGKAALSEGLKPYMEGNQIVGTFILKNVWIDGNHATRFGEWDEVVTPRDGGPAEHHIGRCILNWEKIDGEWKVVSEFVNYLVPPTALE